MKPSILGPIRSATSARHPPELHGDTRGAQNLLGSRSQGRASAPEHALSDRHPRSRPEASESIQEAPRHARVCRLTRGREELTPGLLVPGTALDESETS